ncbi:hypothetical protein V6N11_069895 [Hibiscus sabdariffa]|uniref:Uncharacterized protein n=2 Tax=Hibiscus sabdariffa TaxID=183260 RepID=A0ABR2BM65_9ROSI
MGGLVLGGAPFMMKRSVSFSGVDKCEEVHMDDELSDDGSHLGEKKKRLNLEQVKALEKSFELGNKLEPDRKLELAKALGLKPRQVAIWFQNRRARWKTKQLEKDYDVLKKQFEALKADTAALQALNNKLSAELLCLRSKESNEISIKSDASMVQLYLQGSSRTNIPCTKLDQAVQEEGFCHMLNQVDEQQGFWPCPWGEQHNIH